MTLLSKAFVSPVNKTWAQSGPNTGSYCPKSHQNRQQAELALGASTSPTGT